MGVLNSGTLHHTCWVVHDLEKTAKALADSLSLSWSLWTIEPEGCTVHGRNVPYSFRVAIAAVGNSNFELISPHTGESVYVEHLKAKGEGFHHTCILYESREALQEARDELLKQGKEMLQSGDLGETGEFYYFEMPETDSVIELLYLTDLPPPEMMIE